MHQVCHSQNNFDDVFQHVLWYIVITFLKHAGNARHLNKAFAQSHKITAELSGGLFIILICLFISHYIIQNRIITKPLQRIEIKANEISEDENLLGNELAPGMG